MPVTAVRQEADDLIGGLLVVGGNRGEIAEAKGLSAVGQQQAGNVDGLKPGLEQLQVAAQEHDARRLPLPAQLQGVGHLVGVLVQVVDRRVPSRVPQQGLDALYQIGEQHVLGALDDDGDAGARLLLEVLGVVVGLKAVFLDYRHNPAAGLLADVGVVVENAGYGGYAEAGQAGDILDGHGCTLLSGDDAENSMGKTNSYPFTAPAATPLMMCFWQAR